MISSVYFLFYLYTGSLKFLNVEQNASSKQEFSDAKVKSTPESMCQGPKLSQFKEFVVEIFSLKFEEAPNYQRLQELLINILIENKKTVSK